MTDENLDAGDSHTVLADHLRRVVREVLDAVTGEDRLARQVELVNRILRELEAADLAKAIDRSQRRRAAC